MALHGFCAYKDQAAHGAGPHLNGVITGHHIIPDHCFYYTSGQGKESCVVIEGYHIGDAPVVLVTADSNGGKSREHGLIHRVFDPIELNQQTANKNQWTYADARSAAAKSVNKVLGISEAQIVQVLDDYFQRQLGLADKTLIRAGEHGVMANAPDPRRSKRFKSN